MDLIKIFKKISIYIFITINVKIFASAEFMQDIKNPYGIDFPVQSDAVYFINLDTNTVIYEKNKDLKIPSSSLVKILTTIVTLESEECVKDPKAFLNKEITAKRYIFDRLFKTGAATADIRPDETITIKDALYATMLASSCEAAMMLADYFCGQNTNEFVDIMNSTAEKLGMKDTNCTDADGLDTEHQFTTAKDMYKLIKHCLKNNIFKKIALSRTYDIPPTNKHTKPTTLVHRNKLTNKGLGLGYFVEGVRGIKTGDTDDKQNLVSVAENKEKYHYLLITLGAPKTKEKSVLYEESKNFYNWAFTNLKLEVIAIPGEKIIPNPIKVNMGKNVDSVVLTTKKQVVMLLPKTIDKSTIYWHPSDLVKEKDAPISKGTSMGWMDLMLSGQVIGKVEVVAAKDVEVDIFSYISNLVIKTIFSWWFITLSALTSTLIALAIINKKLSNKKNKKYKPIK